MSSSSEHSRNASIISRNVRGETFRDIHASYPDISYSRIVEIARNFRHHAARKVDEGARVQPIASDYGLELRELLLLIEKARKEREGMREREEARIQLLEASNL